MRIYHVVDRKTATVGPRKFRQLITFYKLAGIKDWSPPEYCLGVFLDSGAYSAFTQNKIISVVEYADFLESNIGKCELAASLDVIGDPEASWKNQRYLEGRGFSVVPVFHVGDDVRFLDRCLDFSYMALGGMVPLAGSPELVQWIARTWDYLDRKGRGGIRVHGFGLGDLSLIQSFPWASVDCFSAVMAGAMGNILTPWGIVDCSRSNSMSKAEKECLVGWAAEEVPGVTWEKLSEISAGAGYLRKYLSVVFLDSFVGGLESGGALKPAPSFDLGV